jgi:glycosyltransferase involved in cell wall biosynthesis
MPPIRIVELRSTYRDGGGPDKTILLSAKGHRRDRFDVCCIYLRGAEDHTFSLACKAKALNVPFEEIVERGKFDLRPVISLIRRINRHRPHIIHTHDYKSDILGYLLHPLFHHSALLATAHGWTLDSGRMRIYNRLDQHVMSRFYHLIAVSEATRRQMISAGIPASKITVLYNGIDIDAWKPGDREAAAAAIKQELVIPPQARLLGLIGRLSPEKNIPMAMKVARCVLDDEPDTHVLVVGDGAAQAELRNIIQALDLGPRIHVLGYRPVTPQLFQAIDVYYMTSQTEGLPNTLLEAMASGCASAVTSVGGIPELVGESGGALLCPTDDVDGLAKGIIALLQNPDRARRMGQAARSRIVESFSFSERLRRIEALYESLAAMVQA